MVTKRSRESLAWRGIRNTGDILMKGCRWKVGNGVRISFWNDAWLDSGHRLRDVVVQPIPLNLLDQPLSFFYEENRGWKSYLFSNILPCRFVSEILTTRIPGGCDVVNWSRNPSGVFTTKSAFELLDDNEAPRGCERLWKAVWRLQGPQRVRIFAWKLLNNDILTNVVRFRHHISSNDICPLC